MNHKARSPKIPEKLVKHWFHPSARLIVDWLVGPDLRWHKRSRRGQSKGEASRSRPGSGFRTSLANTLARSMRVGTKAIRSTCEVVATILVNCANRNAKRLVGGLTPLFKPAQRRLSIQSI